MAAHKHSPAEAYRRDLSAAHGLVTGARDRPINLATSGTV
jgi:hypothetical protein